MNDIFLPSGKNDTPFNPQLQHFDHICGQIEAENKVLRIVVVIAALSFLLSVGITLYAVTLPESVPVLVAINDVGESQYIGAVSRRNYKNFNVPEIAILWQVKEFITLHDTLYTDKTCMRKNINKSLHLCTQQAGLKLNQLNKENNPYADFSERTKEVLFETQPLRLSGKTYQVDYHVITRMLNGSVTKNELYRAVITIEMLKPTEDDIKDNPLGIYVSDFDFKLIDSQVYEGPKK